MLYLMVTACLQNIIEAYQIALYIGIGISDAIAYTSLCGEVNNHLWFVLGEEVINSLLISDIVLNKYEASTIGCELCQALVLESHIIVVGNAIDTDNFYTVKLIQEALYQIGSDEACRTCHQYDFVVEGYVVCNHNF